MRNFHQISNVSFETYTINCGEYVSDDVDVTVVMQAVGSAFETAPALMSAAWRDVCEGEAFTVHIAPSEYDVLVSLLEFSCFVAESIRTDGKTTKSKVFSYFNLNTGKSVVWAHFVC